MTTAVKIRTALLSVIAVMTGLFFLLFLGTTGYFSPIQYGRVQLNEGWTVSRGKESWKPASLVDSKVGITNNGDEIVLTRTLPMSNIQPATLCFRTCLSSVRVYLDEKKIYSFGDKYVSRGMMLPKVENFVRLPDGYQEKEIKIVIDVHEDNAFSGLSPVYFGNYNDIKNYLVQSNRFPMIIGVYLCHLGFMLIILSPFLAFADNHDYSIFFSALASLVMGIYIMCYNDCFWYLSDNPNFFTFVEYLSLFMIPVVIICFTIASGKSRFKPIYIVLLILNLIFSLGSCALHLANVIHISRLTPILHIIVVSEGLFIVVTLVITYINEQKYDDAIKGNFSSTGTLIIGLILFLLCAVVDIIKYNIMKFSTLGEVNAHINFLTVGTLFFVMCLLLNYFFHCIEYANESTVKIQLEGIAYTDALTGLSNRAHCEQVLAGLKKNFTIISLDLDYLKYTNDNYGHGKGDELLSGFSEILKNCFTDATLVGRMGGDEFMIILPFVDNERCERDLRGLSDQLTYHNSQNSSLRYSASWGYAASNDPDLSGDRSAQNVYLLADKRMYTMKNRHHNQSLGRLYDDLLNHMTGYGGKQT